MYTKAYSGIFNNNNYININFLFFHFNVAFFSTKFKSTYVSNYNDIKFNARLSLFK